MPFSFFYFVARTRFTLFETVWLLVLSITFIYYLKMFMFDSRLSVNALEIFKRGRAHIFKKISFQNDNELR